MHNKVLFSLAKNIFLLAVIILLFVLYVCSISYCCNKGSRRFRKHTEIIKFKISFIHKRNYLKCFVFCLTAGLFPKTLYSLMSLLKIHLVLRLIQSWPTLGRQSVSSRGLPPFYIFAFLLTKLRSISLDSKV